MYLSEFDSVELGYMRKWNENLRSSLSVGSLVYKDSDFSENNPDQNKRLINASVNLFWTPVEKSILVLNTLTVREKHFQI